MRTSPKRSNLITVFMFLIALIIASALVSCGGGGGGGGGTTDGDANTGDNNNDMPVLIQESAAQSLGSSGGSVALSDGTSISFPANALSSTTTITITRTNSPSSGELPVEMQYSVNGLFYKFEPDGLIMNSKAMVTVPYGTLPAGNQPSDLTVAYYDGQGWVDVPVSSIDSATGTISFQTDHFTQFRLDSRRAVSDQYNWYLRLGLTTTFRKKSGRLFPRPVNRMLIFEKDLRA